MLNLTDRDKMVFEFIKQQLDEGYPPTVREICANFGFKSTSTAHRCIHNLVREGLLEKGDNQNRALRLAGNYSKTVPLLGTATAGTPITAIQHITNFVSFTPDKHYSNPLFALKVRGESMINVGIMNGDIVIVEQRSVVENGEIAVILVDYDSATVKRFYKEDGHFRLQPENDNMDAIIVDECKVLGKVVGVVRYY